VSYADSLGSLMLDQLPPHSIWDQNGPHPYPWLSSSGLPYASGWVAGYQQLSTWDGVGDPTALPPQIAAQVDEYETAAEAWTAANANVDDIIATHGLYGSSVFTVAGTPNAIGVETHFLDFSTPPNDIPSFSAVLVRGSRVFRVWQYSNDCIGVLRIAHALDLRAR
jgi:hypothetical protein